MKFFVRMRNGSADGKPNERNNRRDRKPLSPLRLSRGRRYPVFRFLTTRRALYMHTPTARPPARPSANRYRCAKYNVFPTDRAGGGGDPLPPLPHTGNDVLRTYTIYPPPPPPRRYLFAACLRRRRATAMFCQSYGRGKFVPSGGGAHTQSIEQCRRI